IRTTCGASASTAGRPIRCFARCWRCRRCSAELRDFRDGARQFAASGHTYDMRTFAALLLLIVGCSKHSQHELGQAADDLNHAAHHTAHAVTESAADDADALGRELHEVEAKLKDKTDALAHDTDDTARKTDSDAVDALKRQRDDLKAKLDAARAGSGSAGSASP